MSNVVYSSPYVPAEWIAAHGLRPTRISSGLSDGRGIVDLTAGVCPYARGFVNAACSNPDTCALVLTTVCDQMRRAHDLVKRESDLPAFLMNVPSMWQTVASQNLYLSELKRLGRFLAGVGGVPPSDRELGEIMAGYDSRRSLLRSARGYMDSREFSEAVAEFHRTGDVNVPLCETPQRNSGVPLALLGGPIPDGAFGIFDVVRESGGDVALDGTETGERTMPGVFDRRRVMDDPLLELADAYFGSIPDAFRRPNSELYKWLKREIEVRDIRGVILVRHVWCDVWHAEVHRLRGWLPVPLLDMDLDEENPITRSRGRVQAFMENLK